MFKIQRTNKLMTRKEVSFGEQMMFKDKHTSVLSFNYFAARGVYEQLTVFGMECILMGVVWYYSMNEQIFLILCNICIIVVNVTFENWPA